MRIVLEITSPWSWARRRWRAFWAMRQYRKDERASLPDGTRVRLTCKCSRSDHGGVWTTEWTPRRMARYGSSSPWEEPSDYRLTRESDGATTYAHRDVLEVVNG